MRLALVTKLKNGVVFGIYYISVALTIHPHAIDGYEMLYNIISHVHPRLMRNKATRPLKPSFNGDIHQYTSSYRRRLTLQENRDIITNMMNALMT